MTVLSVSSSVLNMHDLKAGAAVTQLIVDNGLDCFRRRSTAGRRGQVAVRSAYSFITGWWNVPVANGGRLVLDMYDNAY